MIKFLHLRRKRRAEIADPGFSSALDRVRDIREHADWPPIVDQATIHQRAARVADVRRHVAIPSPPPPCEYESPPDEPPSQPLRTRIIWGIFAGLVCVVLVRCLALWLPELPEFRPVVPKVQAATIGFLLPDSVQYGSLTAQEAQVYAHMALRASGLNPREWYLSQNSYTGAEPFLRRVSYYEGTLRYAHSETTWEVNVTVKLDPEDKYVLCTIEPR